MIDTHSHINFEEYKKDFDGFLSDIKQNDIEKVIIPGVAPSAFDEIVEYCQKYDMIFGAVGIHPSEQHTFNEQSKQKIYELAKNPKIVAIGEIGLDYHYGADTKEEQKKVLLEQLEIAQNVKLPVIIHDRDAHNDTFDILQNFKLKDVIFHCFSGNSEFALKCLDKGYYIAIGGVVTFKNAFDLTESVKIIPLDRLLLETDAPYLAPVPYRGKLNTPAYLKYIAQKIADLKNIDAEDVKLQTTINAERIFKF